jgi:hypothetical protein
MSASSGQAVPCRAEAPVCKPPPGGLQPSYFVERLTMVGMPASASFAFDSGNKLVQTVVLFADTDPALMAGLLQGIHGKPVDEAQGVWRDERRGTIITAIAGRGTMLLYRPAAGR